jgi:electron transfer flavoprotein beta subunit
MKIVATVKRTPQYDTRMKLSSDGALVTENIQYQINPFDELGVEEALRIKEQSDGEVIALAVGDDPVNEQVQTALAMGADRGLRVKPGAPLDALQTAHALAAAIRREEPQLVLMGKLAIDTEDGQVPLMVAELLDWPHASCASKVELAESKDTVRVTCEVDGGLEVVELTLPAVITTDLRLNEPRYASLPGILRAKKKPSEVVALGDLTDVPATSKAVQGYRPLPQRQQGEMVESAEQLAEKLIAKNLV